MTRRRVEVRATYRVDHTLGRVRGRTGRGPNSRDIRGTELLDPCGVKCPGPGSLGPGGLPEWSKGVVCKTAGSAYVGSNPTPATLYRPRIPGPAFISSHDSAPARGARRSGSRNRRLTRWPHEAGLILIPIHEHSNRNGILGSLSRLLRISRNRPLRDMRGTCAGQTASQLPPAAASSPHWSA